jgi:CheY-like chemotaxis protein
MVSMPKKILIVEDYAVNRSFVKFLLEEDGYEVLEAENFNGFGDARNGRTDGDGKDSAD